MASKPSKPKLFTFSCLLFLAVFTFFTLRYLIQLHNEFQIGAQITQFTQNPKWFEMIAHELGHDHINIGLVNMDEEWEAFHTTGEIVEAHFDHVNESVKWSDLYPEWIDENAPPKCPNLPLPRFEEYENLDVVVARVPFGECNVKSGMRDVFRLQVNLVVANLMVRSGRRGNGKDNVYAVFLGEVGPMWEIFRCEDLLWKGKNVWVYKPELWRIKHKVALPVGSCQVAPLFAQSGEELWRSHKEAQTGHLSLRRPQREAYVTVLHSSESYVCGAIVLAQSILQSNSTKDLILLADDNISQNSVHRLLSAGWKVKRIQRIRSPHSKNGSYNEWNYSKLRIWQLTNYDKLIFIDSDLIVTRNIDALFNYPQISAAGNHKHLFNSGLMVIEPSECTFRTLMKKRFTVGSYNGGDQGFLNEMFPMWHRLSNSMNRLKFFARGDRDDDHQVGDKAHAIHYLGLKPWMCHKDYDCNWDKAEYRQFASDSANERWWRVYDTMPGNLKEHCQLTPRMEDRIRKYREKARNGNYPDGHWRIRIQDPRKGST